MSVAFDAFLFDNKHDAIGAEVGVYAGGHAERLIDSGHIKTIYLVDPYGAAPEYDECVVKPAGWTPEKWLNAKASAWQLFLKHRDKVIPMHFRSSEAAPLIADSSLDFVYIDGNHNKDQVAVDLNSWWSKVGIG